MVAAVHLSSCSCGDPRHCEQRIAVRPVKAFRLVKSLWTIWPRRLSLRPIQYSLPAPHALDLGSTGLGTHR